MAKLIIVVVNKYWECDAILAAFLGEAAPPVLRQHWPKVVEWPRARRNPPRGSAPLAPDSAPQPRLEYALDDTTIELWCVSDLLEHLPDEGKYQSSSERKAERLQAILGRRTPDLVIAVGTAGAPVPSENWNGAVVVGSGVFAHDGDPANAHSRWSWTFDTLVPSSLPPTTFAAVTAIGSSVLPRLLPTPRLPSSQRALFAQHDFVSLGTVNVTDYKKYATADAENLAAFAAAKTGTLAGSLETTHAVIRAILGGRFLFVSGIVNRLGHFDADVGAPGFNPDPAIDG